MSRSSRPCRWSTRRLQITRPYTAQNSDWVPSFSPCVRPRGASDPRGAAPRGAVFLQQRHAAEGAGADATLVLLHLGVGLQVSAQIGAVGEGPVAVGAREWPLTWEKEDRWGGEERRVI